MSNSPLFPDLEGDEPTERPPADLGPAPPPRLRRPDREQLLMRPCAIDELIGDDHDSTARLAAGRGPGTSPRSSTSSGPGVETPGRSATDPKLLVAAGSTPPRRASRGAGNWRASARSMRPVPLALRHGCPGQLSHAQRLPGRSRGRSQGPLGPDAFAVLIHGELVTVSRIAQRRAPGSRAREQGPKASSDATPSSGHAARPRPISKSSTG